MAWPDFWATTFPTPGSAAVPTANPVGCPCSEMFQIRSPITATASTGTATAENRGHHDGIRDRPGRLAATTGSASGWAATTGATEASTRARSSWGGCARGAAYASADATASSSRSAAMHSGHSATCCSTRGLLVRIERPQGMGGDQLSDVFHSSSVSIPASWSAVRSAAIAANVRLFTVPSGSASRSASSLWV